MKISLYLTDTVKSGLAVGASLQLVLSGAGEVVAQTQNVVDSETFNFPLHPVEQISPAKVRQISPAKVRPSQDFLEFHKEFAPDNNGKPRDTRGTGTRCIHDSLEPILHNLLG